MKEYQVKIKFRATDEAQAGQVAKALGKMLKHANNKDIIKIGDEVEKDPALIQAAISAL